MNLELNLSAAQAQCPKDWEYFQGSCYTLGYSDLDFREAEKTCEEIDGYLAEITSEEENDFVKDLIRSGAYDTETGAYIGARQTFNMNWRWEKSRDDVSFSDWAKPDRRRIGRNSKCASLNKDDDWSWVEQDCARSQGMTSVCERCLQQEKCKNGKCYEILCNVAEYDDIQERCENVGRNVAVIDSEKEYNFIKDFLSNASIPKSELFDTGNVWLSLSDEDTEGSFILPDGTEMTFVNWASGQPDNNGLGGREEDCVVLDASMGWSWNDVMCFTENAVLCESPK